MIWIRWRVAAGATAGALCSAELRPSHVSRSLALVSSPAARVDAAALFCSVAADHGRDYRRASKHFFGDSMVVDIPINASSLGDTMGRMRSWLDEHNCTPVLFATKSEQPGAVLIHVEFADAADAAAFRAAFGAAEPEASAAAA